MLHHTLSLRTQVAKLKGSRDKLLAQIDKQWEEMDRLAAEHKSVADELERARAVAEGWEAQAQDGLAHVERLKEMLEEAASWSSGQGGAGGGGGGAANPYMAAVNGTSASEWWHAWNINITHQGSDQMTRSCLAKLFLLCGACAAAARA